LVKETTLLRPLTASANGYIVVPKWFVSFLSFLTSVLLVGAAVWASTISNDVSTIKADLRATNRLQARELEDVRRRLDRHDQLFDRLLPQGRP